MKYLFLLVIVIGCGTKDQKEKLTPNLVRNEDYTGHHYKTDTVTKTPEPWRLALDYFKKEMDSKVTSDSFAIEYYRTGKEKYRILANKYGDSTHYWNMKLQEVAKASKTN